MALQQELGPTHGPNVVAPMPEASPTVVRAPAAGRAAPPDPKWQAAARLALSIALLALGLYILGSFVRALLWAVVFAIALWPLYERVSARTGPALRKEVLPLIFTLLTGFAFLLPFAALTFEVVREIHQVVDLQRQTGQSGIPAPDLLYNLPFGAEMSAWWNAHLAHQGWTTDILREINTSSNRELGRNVGVSVAHRTFLFVISLLTLFFLFREGGNVSDQALIAIRKLFGERGERVGLHMAAAVHGTVNGLVLVGLGEGVILFVVYILARVPHPILFAALAALAALIPFASYLAIGAAALFAYASGGLGPTLAVVISGAVVVFIADHFVRPTLIGGTTKLPFLWVLLGILGGVETLQLLGLFIGPAVMAALMLLWRELVSGPDI